MEKRERNLSIHSRRWGVISLLEGIKKIRNVIPKEYSENRIPKRLKTDFFPNRHKGRKYHKERTYFLTRPENPYKVFWNIIKTFLLMVEAFLIPFLITFSPLNLSSYQLTIQLIETFFVFDIIYTFNTEVYYNGALFSSRLYIAKHYLKGWFIFDFIAVFPFELLIPEVNMNAEYLYISANTTQALKFLWLVKLVRLFQTRKLVYDIEDFFVSSVFLGPIRAVEFLFSAFIWTHWLTCMIYAFFARGLDAEPSLWKQLLPDPYDNYLRKFYLVVETMTSVGYGDILPVTTTQRIVAVISMCFACVLFGNIIGNIQGYIENYGADEKYYENTARRLKNHLKNNKLPPELRERVVKYIYYLKNLNQRNGPQEINLLESLSAPLKEEIYIQTRGYLLASSAVFRIYSGSFLKYLGHQMKTEVFAPGDQIFKEGEMSNSIFYLCSGKVQIYHEATKTVFKDIKKNKYFGEISFFLDTCRTASAMCLVFSEFLILERSAFFTVLHSRPRELDLTRALIYTTGKYNNLAALGVRCYLCRKMGHIAKNCTAFIYIPDQNHAAKRAEVKKYVKTVNSNTLNPAINFKRQDVSCDILMNYDLYNTKGIAFTPRIKYRGNNRIISKAWSMEGKRHNRLFIDGMKPIREGSNESDSDQSEAKISEKFYDSDNSIPDINVTFGNNP